MKISIQDKSIAQRVYDWEAQCVEPKAGGFLSRDECHELIERACAFSKMAKPQVRISKATYMSCRAIPGKWQLVFAGWGRTGVTVLHEVAHLATYQDVIRGEDGHGPAFVGQAIEYYSTFLGIDIQYLIRTANEFRIPYRFPYTQITKSVTKTDFERVEF